MERKNNEIVYKNFNNFTPSSVNKTELTSAGFFIYIPAIEALWRSKIYTEMGVLFLMCRDMKFGFNTIHVTPEWRRDAMDELSISKSRISVAIANLVERGFIAESNKKFHYRINWYLFFKGYANQRENLLTMIEKFTK